MVVVLIRVIVVEVVRNGQILEVFLRYNLKIGYVDELVAGVKGKSQVWLRCL